MAAGKGVCVCQVYACVLGVGTGRQGLSPRQSISCRINIISPRVRKREEARGFLGKGNAWAILVKCGVLGGW